MRELSRRFSSLAAAYFELPRTGWERWERPFKLEWGSPGVSDDRERPKEQRISSAAEADLLPFDNRFPVARAEYQEWTSLALPLPSSRQVISADVLFGSYTFIPVLRNLLSSTPQPH